MAKPKKKAGGGKQRKAKKKGPKRKAKKSTRASSGRTTKRTVKSARRASMTAAQQMSLFQQGVKAGAAAAPKPRAKKVGGKIGGGASSSARAKKLRAAMTQYRRGPGVVGKSAPDWKGIHHKWDRVRGHQRRVNPLNLKSVARGAGFAVVGAGALGLAEWGSGKVVAEVARRGYGALPGALAAVGSAVVMGGLLSILSPTLGAIAAGPGVIKAVELGKVAYRQHQADSGGDKPAEKQVEGIIPRGLALRGIVPRGQLNPGIRGVMPAGLGAHGSNDAFVNRIASLAAR